MRAKTIPIFLVFLAMGFGDVVGPLVSLAKETFNLTNFFAQLLSFSGFIMFGVLSIPMGVYQDKKGKKFILMLGLVIAFIGLVIPILNGMFGPKVVIEEGNIGKFATLLVSIFLLGAGATILQVSGNPIMRDVSEEGQFSSNLSLGQSIKAIGSSLGFLLPPAVAVAFGMDWSILFPIYGAIVFITAIMVYSLNVKEKKDNAEPASLGSCLKLLRNPYVFAMVFAIFLYVGAEVSMSSQVPILMKESFGLEQFGLWISWALFFLPIFLGRLFGAFILRKMNAVKFLLITVILSLLGIILLLTGINVLAFSGIILVGLGFANIFPLIFSITVDHMPERANELSGLMVTAIVGGAILPPVTGFVADLSSVLFAFIVPLLALIYIFFVSIMNSKKGL